MLRKRPRGQDGVEVDESIFDGQMGDVNGVDGEGVWPLLAAVRCRQEAMARLLVDQGARSQRDTTRLCNELHVLAVIQKGGPFPTPVTLRPYPRDVL
jgi:hypothetical protein